MAQITFLKTRNSKRKIAHKIRFLKADITFLRKRTCFKRQKTFTHLNISTPLRHLKSDRNFMFKDKNILER